MAKMDRRKELEITSRTIPNNIKSKTSQYLMKRETKTL